MQKVELDATLRDRTGTTKSRNDRLDGQIPAIVYGKKSDSISIVIDGKTFMKVIGSKAGKNVIITLKIASKDKTQDIPVLTHDVQVNPINDKIIHVDFYKIKMEEEIKTKIHVVLTGEPIGVKMDGGILIHKLREIEIRCLPIDIPDKYVVDVSAMKIGNNIHVSDLKVEKGVTVLTPATEAIVSIAAPSKEEVEVAPVTAPEVTGQTVPTGEAAVTAAGAKEAAPAKGAPAPAAAPAKGAAAPVKASAPEAKKK